jgi:pyridoxamine 5'-phosphate oxidase
MAKVPPQRLPEPLPQNPLTVVKSWVDEAYQRALQPNPNAMTLATADATGRPSARIVLLKDLVLSDGYGVFVTNYLSRKGREFAKQPRVAAVMHWDALHRQVRLEGHLVRSPDAESDRYFAIRPWQSRVGAWASAQSQPVTSREQLIEQWRAEGRRFGTPPVGPDERESDAAADVAIPRPPHWGALRIWIDAVELWVEGDYRIHDRVRWTRSLDPRTEGDGFTGSPWQAQRLQP